ncbi:unnamed protein product [Psylliodes chrysocephalus]|uniref:DUF4371 domain-containing protein n=1 Tax=Psylliodes chrysocephalus TaxID=3402493 RepID=A0A9P0CWZ9_9CUCU|nr:unnamed protein product [Psylliodes chrysocephala]
MLTFDEKQRVVEIGRPTPPLKLIQLSKKTTRYFNKSYDNYKWLCGCIHDNKLYCWSCLLFSEYKNVWNVTGYIDLNNFSNASKKHDQSTNHLNSALALHSFGKTRIERSLSRQIREEIERHNAKVDRNRNVMRRLIDITYYLAKQELPFRGHIESAESANRGNFIECIKLLANYDGILSDHLQQSAYHDQNKTRAGFSGLSNRIQNDCVAVMIDETPNVSGKEQLCIILRYFDQSHEVVDRFVGFVDVSSNRTAEVLTKMIIDFLNDYKCCTKLILQTYDGAAALSSEKNGVQKKVRETCPDALYVWCIAHILNLVLSKSCQRNSETKHFFSTTKNLATFFHTGTKRSDLYNKFCSKKLPRVVVTRWVYNSRTINIIFSEHKNLLNILNNICENEANWDGDTLSAARMYEFTLNDFEFNYFLEIFNAIFIQTDILFNIIESKIVDIGYCLKKVKGFKNFIDNFYNEFENIYERTVTFCGEPKKKAD